MKISDTSLRLLVMFALAGKNWHVKWLIGLELQQELKGYY